MMCHQLLTTSVLVSLISSTIADILGPVYPPPVDLSSATSVVPSAWNEITNVLDGYFNGSLGANLASSFSGAENVTFSIGAFSLNDPAALDTLQYHHTSAEVINGNGTDHVDADSIYILASITKVFTAFSGLLALTDEEWNRPLTQCIPGLAEYVAQLAPEDPIMNTQWDKITPWALANQISGVAEQPPQLDLYISLLVSGSQTPSELGLSSVPEFESETTCVTTCPASAYAESVKWYHPTRLPWSGSLYSNNGFVLLGIAIANITGTPMAQVFNETIFRPLNLASTLAGAPTSEADIARTVITNGSALLTDAGVFVSSGGVYSTIRDLSTFGAGILNSSLLTPEATHRWLKPTSHTANLNYSVGAPWEIIRYTSPSTGKVTDLYTKSGQSGDANTHFVLIPDYNTGFTYLSASTDLAAGANLIGPVLDLVTANLLPALETQAAAEATANFAGTYTSTDANLNSSVIISFNESTATGVGAALSISSWISNGTDMLEWLYDGAKPRLLMSIKDEENGKVAFYVTPRSSIPSGPFTGTLATNGDFFIIDAQRYGGVALGLFVFDVDGSGNATMMSPEVTGMTLQRNG